MAPSSPLTLARQWRELSGRKMNKGITTIGEVTIFHRASLDTLCSFAPNHGGARYLSPCHHVGPNVHPAPSPVCATTSVPPHTCTQSGHAATPKAKIGKRCERERDAREVNWGRGDKRGERRIPSNMEAEGSVL